MTTQTIAAALQRVEAVVRRRPEVAMHDESPVTARWAGGSRVVARHGNGTEIASDLPRDFGGGGEEITPGWLFRAGFASCTAGCILMGAAAQGIELASLEVRVTSRADIRGALGIADADGRPVHAGPRDVQLAVRISAPGVDPARLRALVEKSYDCSPTTAAMRNPVPIALQIEIDDA